MFVSVIRQFVFVCSTLCIPWPPTHGPLCKNEIRFSVQKTCIHRVWKCEESCHTTWYEQPGQGAALSSAFWRRWAGGERRGAGTDDGGGDGGDSGDDDGDDDDGDNDKNDDEDGEGDDDDADDNDDDDADDDADNDDADDDDDDGSDDDDNVGYRLVWGYTIVSTDFKIIL